MRSLHVAGLAKPENIFYHDTGYGEFVRSKTGVTLSDPNIFRALDEKHGFSNPQIESPWLYDETRELADKVSEHPSTLILGEYGAGKSTLMYGLRTVMRQEGKPYAYIDGHYVDKHRIITNIIKSAQNNDRTVVFDSWDYLFINKGSKKRHAIQGREPVICALQEHIDSGGKLVATSHTSPWFTRHSSPELAEYKEELIQGFDVVHSVTGYLKDARAVTVAATPLFGVEYAQYYAALAAKSGEPTSKTYRVMKNLGRVLQARANINGGSIDDELELMEQNTFDGLVCDIDSASRKLVGLPDDHRFEVPES
jgi:energy-coupling factor transporter ATP-binding protein EcfA2